MPRQPYFIFQWVCLRWGSHQFLFYKLMDHHWKLVVALVDVSPALPLVPLTVAVSDVEDIDQ